MPMTGDRLAEDPPREFCPAEPGEGALQRAEKSRWWSVWPCLWPERSRCRGDLIFTSLTVIDQFSTGTRFPTETG